MLYFAYDFFYLLHPDPKLWLIQNAVGSVFVFRVADPSIPSISDIDWAPPPVSKNLSCFLPYLTVGRVNKYYLLYKNMYRTGVSTHAMKNDLFLKSFSFSLLNKRSWSRPQKIGSVSSSNFKSAPAPAKKPWLRPAPQHCPEISICLQKVDANLKKLWPEIFIFTVY